MNGSTSYLDRAAVSAASPRQWYESFSTTWRQMASVLGLRKLQDMIQGTYALSDQPAWLLGTWYGLKDHDTDEDTLPSEMEGALLADFGCRLWFTYRRDFPPLGASGLTSDAGWGCTLRTGQMMLAEALLRDRLGRQTCRPAAGAGREVMCQVLQLFLDHPSPQHPFSIHNICRCGADHGVVPGQWLGPWVLCKALEAAVATAGPSLGLRVHVVCDPGGGAPQLQVHRAMELLRPSIPEAAAATAAAAATPQARETIPSQPAAETAALAEADFGKGLERQQHGEQQQAPKQTSSMQQQQQQQQQVQEIPSSGGGASTLRKAAVADTAGSTRTSSSSSGKEGQLQNGLKGDEAAAAAAAGPSGGAAAAVTPPGGTSRGVGHVSCEGPFNGRAAPAAAGGVCSAGQGPSGLLLLVPLTLGVGKVNERYLPQLQQVLTFPQTVGIVGGRPGASLYFVGYQQDYIMYLDPHETQEVAVLPDAMETYFGCTPRLMALSAIDPSLAIGFYCQTQDDVQELCQRLQEVTAAAGSAPLLTLEWGIGEENLGNDETADADLGKTVIGQVTSGKGYFVQQDELEGLQGCEESQLDREPSSGDEWQLV